MQLFGYFAQTRRFRRYLFGYLTHMLTLGIGVCMPRFQLPALSTLIAFEAAARHQSVKRAADELHVTHTAVSRHIQRLERQIGHRLFERRHRKIELTVDGEMLLHAVTTGFTHIEQAFVQLSGGQKPDRLVISVDPDFAGLCLVPRLADLYAIMPTTLVEIRAEKDIHALRDPRIDCAIQYAEVGSDIEHGEILFRSRLFPVYAPNLAQRLPLRSPEDLRQHVLLHDRSFAEWQEYLQNCSLTIDVNVGPRAVFSQTVHCMDAAVRGQGVAMGDDFLAALHLSEGRLIKPFESALYSRNAYYFIAPKNSARHLAVSAFRNWLVQSIDRLRSNLPSRRRNRS
jgi:LysR family glycine cleavage system transcriptional activator